MKRLLSLLLSFALVMQGVPAFAAGKAVKFELTLSQTAKVGEALDLGVKVVGKDGETVKDYVGTVYVTVDNDSKATIPYPDGYTFVSGDQGVKTFSKGLAFSKEGTMTVSVTDIDDDKVEGIAKVNVSGASSATTTSGTEAVNIIAPDDGSTVNAGSDVKVSGTTKKNSKVQVFVNGTKSGDTQSDDSGAFLYTVKGISEDTNVISAKVLDGSDKVIGESSKVTVKVGASEGPAFKSIAIKEGNKVRVSTNVNVTVVAEPKLKEVSVALGDTIEVLKETSDGNYTGTAGVPAKAGDYPVDVTLTSTLGKKTVKTAATTLTAEEAPKPVIANVKIVTSPKKATFSFQVVNDSDSVAKFKIEYGTNSGALDKEAVTYDKAKILVKPTAPAVDKPVSFNFFPVVNAATGNDFLKGIDGVTVSDTGATAGDAKGDISGGTGTASVGGKDYKAPADNIAPAGRPGTETVATAGGVAPAKETPSLSGSDAPTYTWYVDGLTEPKYYARVTALDASGSPISGATSDVFEVDMALNAAGKCMIGDISGIKITKKDDTSIISWDALPEALSYNVYKKDATGNYVLIENVKTNSYTVHIAKGDVKYEDFAIKALCTDGKSESTNYGEAVKVQTGPGKIALLALLALGIGFVATRRKFAFLKAR